MEDFEEIENQYRLKLEKEDEEFLEKIKNLKDKESKKNLEFEYREKLRLLLEEYNEGVLNFLKSKSVKLFEESEGAEKKEKNPTSGSVFNVKPFHLTLKPKDKFKIKWKVFRFNFKVSSRNFIRNFLPSKFLISLFSLKLFSLNLYLEIKFYITSFFMRIISIIKNCYFKAKVKSINIYSISKKFFLDFFAKIVFFLKRKKKDSKDSSKQEVSSEKKAVSTKPATKENKLPSTSK